MARYKFLAFSTPVDGADAEFNRWYDEEHLPDVLETPGFVSADRFRIVDAKSSACSVPGFRYVAIYEIDSDDPQGALEELRRRVQSGRVLISESFDRNTVATCLMEALSA